MSKTRVISITSGKGGTGKSNVTLNLGLALAALGKRVLLLDADTGLANLDVLMGITPGRTIFNLLRKGESIQDVLVNYEHNLDLLPGASGIEELVAQSTEDRLILLDAISSLSDYDYMLIDTRAGIGNDVTYFNSAAHETIVVTTPEPTALTDAYAMIKIMSGRYKDRNFGVIVNQSVTSNDGPNAFHNLRRVAASHLEVNLNLIGTVPFDALLRESVNARRPVLTEFPSCPASRAFRYIANQLVTELDPPRIKGGVQFFFQQLLEQGAYGC